MKRLVLLLLLLCSMPGGACLWTTETDVDGKKVTLGGEGPGEWTYGFGHYRGHGEGMAQLAEKVRAEPGNRDYRNDYGVALARAGRVDEALEIFRKLEAEAPGQYQTAANLGTVLELSGKDQEALRWIKEAMRRNPQSHRGTEWVHVRVLEAKLACAKDPKWLETHSILDLDFGREARPQAPDELTTAEERERVGRAIAYQLRERMSLVGPQDVYVGDLLFDLANLIALTKSVERGLTVLRFADDYGTSRPELLQLRMNYFLSLLPKDWSKRETLESATPVATPEPSATPVKADKEPTNQTMLPIILAPVALVLTLSIWQRRRSRRGS